jgi:mannose-6-phosphate isomerase-like protein (cupin superfamily)
MIVGDEEAEVGAGTLIQIPPGTAHAIRNDSAQSLAYVSATVPPFPVAVHGSAWYPA